MWNEATSLASLLKKYWVYSPEEVHALRLEMYGATMIKDGNSDLHRISGGQNLALVSRPDILPNTHSQHGSLDHP